MTTVEPRTDKGRWPRNSAGELWDDCYERIQRERPATADAAWLHTMPLAGLFQFIGDINTVGDTWGIGSAPRGGHGGNGRPDHPVDVVVSGIDRLRNGVGIGLGPRITEDYTTEPFVAAFRYMVGRRTLMQMSRRTAIHRNRIHRLLLGTQRPSGADMEAIASTFSKKPWYFVEYRSTMIAAMVMSLMDRDPDRSAEIARELAS